MSLFLTQIAHRLVWESNPISAAKSLCLTVRDMVEGKVREEGGIARKDKILHRTKS